MLRTICKVEISVFFLSYKMSTEGQPPSPRADEISGEEDIPEDQLTIRTWQSTQKCKSCTSRAEISEHYRQLKCVLKARWGQEFDKIGMTLGFMNRVVAPRISTTAWFNELAVGIPPPRRCKTCRRWSFYGSFTDFHRGIYTTVGGYKIGKIPWEEKGNYICIACLDEYVRWTHDIVGEE